MKKATKDRIKRGIELLDQAKPGWWRPQNINARKLDLADCSMCVVGQLYASDGYPDYQQFTQGLHELRRLWKEGKLEAPRVPNVMNAYYYGFDSKPVESYEELTEAWIEEIETRRRKAHVKVG